MIELDKIPYHYKLIPSWSDNGIIIIIDEGREFLYSLKEEKKISYGYTNILLIENENEDNEINYIKDYDACKVILDVKSSFLPFRERLSHTVIGYLNKRGEVINGLLDLNSKKRYFDAPSPILLPLYVEDDVKRAVENETLAEIREDRLFRRHEKNMIRSLKKRTKE